MKSIVVRTGLAGMWLSGSAVLLAQTLSITEYTTPTANSGPAAIVAGPDGALWFAEEAASKIGRITTAGAVTEYPVTTASAGSISAITFGSDGALWFVEVRDNRIGRITTGGTVTEYPVPTAVSDPFGITPGPDGALWFTELIGNKIGRITGAGGVIEYPVPTANGDPADITAGPDGALWFTEEVGCKIGRITTAGVVTEYAVPTPNSQPAAITGGPDGALWFVESLGNKIGRITTAGVVTEYPVPTGRSLATVPQTIAVGPDGALWFTEPSGNISRITTLGAITEFQPSAPGSPTGVTMGPSGNGALWVTLGPGSIGRLVPPLPPPGILTGGILNAASYALVNGAAAPVAPGSLVAIFTSNLGVGAASFTGTSLPPSINGVSVTFKGVPAPMVAVSPPGTNPYVSAEVPFEILTPGQSSTVVPTVISVNGVPSAPVETSIVPSAPGIFTIPATGTGNAILVFLNPATNAAAIAAPANAAIGYPAVPIPRGTPGFFYVTGLGAMTPPVTDGSGICPASNGICNANATPQVFIGGVSAPVAFAGQAYGFPGVFQVNITVPENAPTGNNVSLVVKSADGSVSSNVATIAVQ